METGTWTWTGTGKGGTYYPGMGIGQGWIKDQALRAEAGCFAKSARGKLIIQTVVRVVRRT